MIRRRAVTGLTLLSALLFCAFAAQSASAIVVTKSNNTTTFTCAKVEKGTVGFSDAHCEKGVSEGASFEHKSIPLNTPTELDATNEKVTEETKSIEPFVLKGTLGLAKVTIECTTMNTNSPKSSVENYEPGASKHAFTGNGEAEYTNCNVKELAKCIVTEPIRANANFYGVEGMEGPKGEKNAMGVEFVGPGAEEVFGNIEFKNKGAEVCSVAGKSFAVKGRVVGTSGPTTESAQENKASGATIVFTPKFKMQTLKFGANPAEASFIATPTGNGGPPVSITTTT